MVRRVVVYALLLTFLAASAASAQDAPYKFENEPLSLREFSMAHTGTALTNRDSYYISRNPASAANVVGNLFTFDAAYNDYENDVYLLDLAPSLHLDLGETAGLTFAHRSGILDAQGGGDGYRWFFPIDLGLRFEADQHVVISAGVRWFLGEYVLDQYDSNLSTGFGFGLQAEIRKVFSVGMRFISEGYNLDIDQDYDIKTPAVFGVGVSLHPIPWATFCIDYDHQFERDFALDYYSLDGYPGTDTFSVGSETLLSISGRDLNFIIRYGGGVYWSGNSNIDSGIHLNGGGEFVIAESVHIGGGVGYYDYPGYNVITAMGEVSILLDDPRRRADAAP